jgi:hypothetical protein
MLPRSGDVLHITRAASVQFSKPMLFRVIRIHSWPTYHGWLWLDGYELNPVGDAVVRRSILVQRAGLRKSTFQPTQRRGIRPAPTPPRNDGPYHPARTDPATPIRPEAVARLRDPRRNIGGS